MIVDVSSKGDEEEAVRWDKHAVDQWLVGRAIVLDEGWEDGVDCGKRKEGERTIEWTMVVRLVNCCIEKSRFAWRTGWRWWETVEEAIEGENVIETVEAMRLRAMR